jgi:hypothetical protein
MNDRVCPRHVTAMRYVNEARHFIWPTGCRKDDGRSGAHQGDGPQALSQPYDDRLGAQAFEFGTKEFSLLNSIFRNETFNAVASSELPGLIFTYVWALDDPRDKSYIDDIASKVLMARLADAVQTGGSYRWDWVDELRRVH